MAEIEINLHCLTSIFFHFHSEVVRQCIPGHRTGDGERPTAERAATMSWYNKMVEAGTSKSLTTGNARWYGIVEFNVPLDTL